MEIIGYIVFDLLITGIGYGLGRLALRFTTWKASPLGNDGPCDSSLLRMLFGTCQARYEVDGQRYVRSNDVILLGWAFGATVATLTYFMVSWVRE